MAKIDTSRQIKISTEYITLGQLLKFANVIDEGGMAKFYLSANHVLVNGEEENRRGKKLRGGDVVELKEGKFEIVNK